MTSTPAATTYANHDLTYEFAHRATFSQPKKDITAVLPPVENVFVGEALVDYVDPYDVYEDDEERREVLSAAVTWVSYLIHCIPWTNREMANVGWMVTFNPASTKKLSSVLNSGSVALDLHRMNRTLEVNDTFHYAVVEQGVTCTELYEYCKAHGKQVWPSLHRENPDSQPRQRLRPTLQPPPVMSLHEVAKEKGYGMYRGHVQHMDRIAALNDFNNYAYRRLLDSIKDTVDPNGILAPGKQGIWPEKYRHYRSV
ncbi:hypothetical protein BDW69DRAFT_179889 [Aspergillus filifer]